MCSSCNDGHRIGIRVADDHTVKVADFGLSRDLFDQDYYRMEDLSKPLPIRWMAVECLTAQVFTQKSDVVSRRRTLACNHRIRVGSLF